MICGFLGYSGALFVLRTGVMSGLINHNYLIGLFVLIGALVGLALGLPVFKGIRAGSKKNHSCPFENTCK